LADIVDEKAAFDEFEARYRREYGVFYEFLTSFYDMHASEESYFWAARKVTQDSHSELEAFVNLVGGMSSGEASLARAESVASRFKSRSTEFANAVDALSGEAEQGSMVPLFRSAVVRQALQEGAQVQTQALLGEDAEPDFPIFPGGFIPSADGMLWALPD
jgi:halogenation protein CepH